MARLPLKFDGSKIVSGVPTKALTEAGATAMNAAKMVPIENLNEFDGFNVRINDESYDAWVEELATSIFTNGFDPAKPITAYAIEVNGEHKLYVGDGHTRLSAARKAIERGAEIERLPVVVKKMTSFADMTADMALSNNQRNLTMLEVGAIAYRLTKEGLSTDEVAEKIGKTPRHVNDLMVLVGAPPKVRSMVARGQVSATEAITQVRKLGEGAVAKLQAAVDKAQERGKQRATAKDTGRPERPAAAAQQPAQADAGAAVAAAAPDAPSVRVARNEDFLRGAIKYALTLPNGLDWLREWDAGNAPEVLAELEAWMGQPEGSTFDVKLRVPLVERTEEAPAAPAPTKVAPLSKTEVDDLFGGQPPTNDAIVMSSQPQGDDPAPVDLGPEPTVLDKKGNLLGKMLLGKRMEKINAWVAAGGVRTIGDDGQPITDDERPVFDETSEDPAAGL